MAAPANRELRGRSGWEESGRGYRPEAGAAATMPRCRISARACPERVDLEKLTDPSCGWYARLRIARALGLSRRRAELYVPADPRAAAFRGRPRLRAAP